MGPAQDNILHATRSAGITFAQSFIFLMEAGNASFRPPFAALPWVPGCSLIRAQQMYFGRRAQSFPSVLWSASAQAGVGVETRPGERAGFDMLVGVTV